MKLTWTRHSSARSAGAALVLAASLVFAAGCQFNSSADTATAAPDTAQTLATSAPTAATAAPAAATAMPAAATAAPEPTAASAAPDQAASINPAAFTTVIRDVARNVRPGVVQITNQQVQLDQFNQAFTVPAGVGSGVIYDDQGHILTNNHVVEGAQKLLVSLPDGRSFPGTLVGQDPQTDLAVVQIKADNLPIVPLGNSHNLQIGDWVVAIGNALALQGGPTVSQGVVSALGRTVQEPGTDQNTAGPFLFDAIQTLDRTRLADALAAERDKSGRCPQLFMQVNTGEEPQKAGVLPAETEALIAYARKLELPLAGLMCIPPVEDDVAPHFAFLAKLAKENGLSELSMGMSGDFEMAIRFGATHVRVGSAIFGARPGKV